MICLLLIGSCDSNKNRKQAGKGNKTEVTATPVKEVKQINSIRLTSPKKQTTYSYGEEINIAFETKDRFPVDSAIFYLNGHPLAATGKDIHNYTFRIPEGAVGNATLKVVAFHPGQKRGAAAATIRIKPDQAPVKYDYEVVRVYPHDSKAYTQGLVYRDGYMYEGTGQYGESSIRKTDMNTGKNLSVLNIDNQLFGEGITIYGDKIYQLTWRSHKGFIYDLKTFSLESTFQYNSEGWGITTAGDHLIMSDGSNKLYHIAPSTFSIMRETEVYDHQGEVSQLNELEYVGGLVWANVWLTDRIVAIDPETGAVKGELDLSGLLTAAEKTRIDNKDEVLNGIAWNPVSRTFYVTGKRWPKLFEIKIRTNDER